MVSQAREGPTAAVLERLYGVKKQGNGWIARCPAHDDHTASLSVGEGEKGVVLKCHAGCDTKDIVAKLGMALSDMFYERPQPRSRIVTSYDYTDEHGEVLYQAVRFDPKGFRQRRPNGRGGYVWGLGDVRRVLYKLPDVLAADRVFVVEGEKDADNVAKLGLVATTSPMGASADGQKPKWREDYSKQLAGKHVVIIPDNDQPGEAHAQAAALSLLKHAASVRLIHLPNLPDKGDVSDWIKAGATKEELLELAARAEPFTAPAVEVPPAGADGKSDGEVHEPPDQPNQQEPSDGPPIGEDHPIRNHESYRTAKNRWIHYAWTLNDIVKQVNYRMAGFPRRVGSQLFLDKQGRICWLENPNALFAAFHEKGDVLWRQGNDTVNKSFVTKQEFFSYLQSEVPDYGGVTEFPFYPVRPDIYSSWIKPKDLVITGKTFKQLLDHFNPASKVDAALLRALALTMAWGGPPGQRPVFVLTTDDSGKQESGKTQAIIQLASLVGGHFKVELPRGEYGDNLAKQLLSPVALPKRVVLMDNTTGVLRSRELADIITAPYIDGRASHQQQSRRLNLITYCVTTNDLAMSTDLSTRSVVIRLAHPDRDKRPTWQQDVEQFIAEHREVMLAEMLAILEAEKHRIIVPGRNRFPAWCEQVLATDPNVNEVVPKLVEGISEADADAEEVAVFMAELNRRQDAGQLSGMGRRFSPMFLAGLWREVNNEKITTGWVTRRLRAAMARGTLTELKPVGKAHGCDWTWSQSEARLLPT